MIVSDSPDKRVMAAYAVCLLGESFLGNFLKFLKFDPIIYEVNSMTTNEKLKIIQKVSDAYAYIIDQYKVIYRSRKTFPFNGDTYVGFMYYGLILYCLSAKEDINEFISYLSSFNANKASKQLKELYKRFTIKYKGNYLINVCKELDYIFNLAVSMNQSNNEIITFNSESFSNKIQDMILN